MNIYYIFLLIFSLYLFFIILNDKIKLKKKICAVCASVFLTWFFLIILKLCNFNIDNLLIGILIGQSITGLLYLYENYFKEKNKIFLSFRIFLVLILTYIGYYILRLI